MFLSKRSNGIYQVYFEKDGKRTSISTKTKLKSEAIKFLANFAYKLKDQSKRKTIPITLIAFSESFLNYSECNHSWKTTLDYRTTFNFLISNLGNIPLSELSPKIINEYLQSRIKEVSVYAARKDLINISAFLNKAVQDCFIVENPCRYIKRIKLPEKQPLFFSENDFNKLIAVIDIPDIKDIVIFAVNTGLRQMEILTLEWGQIDFGSRLLVLDNRNHLTKNKKVRNVPLNIKAMEILKTRNVNNNIVFTINNKSIKQDFIIHRFKKYVIQAGLNPKLNFHSLRHTFASWLIQKGENIYRISKLLGHSDIKTTEIYAHLRNDDLRQSVELL